MSTLLILKFSVDLTAGSDVHLMEPHWNPMVEAQALDRVHRIGQEREVWTTRYIVDGSIEAVRLSQTSLYMFELFWR